MRILLFLLFPIFLSAQIQRAYGVIEIGSFPTSSATGPKFAYNPADSSFYRWRSGSTWVKVIEPSIISAGWGIIKTGLTYLVDSSKVASRYYVSTSPTTIANNYVATSNGSNLVARNLFDNNTYVGILNSKPFQLGQWSTAGRPTGVNGYGGFNTSFNWPEWYSSSGWFSPARATTTGGAFTTGYIPFGGTGGLTESSNLFYETANKRLSIGRSSPSYYFSIQGNGVSNQALIGLYNSNGAQVASYDTDGSGNGAVIVYNSSGTIQGRFSSGDVSFLTGKIAFGTTIVGTSDFLVSHRQTDIGLTARVGIGNSGNGYPGIGYNLQFTSSNNSYTRKANDQCYFIDMGSNARLSLKTAAAGATGSAITWTENLSVVQSTGNVGINQTNPQRKLDVNGEVRIADLTTDTPTRFVGADADGDLGAITLNSVWRDYQTDKAILGSDSSFVHDPVVDTTRILGTASFGKPATYPQSSSYPFIFRNPNNATTTLLIESGRTSPTGGSAGIQLLASGQFGGSIDFGTATSSDLTFYSYFAGKNLFNIGLSNFVTGNKNTILVGQIQDPIQWDFNGRLVIYDTITSGKALFLAKKVASSSTPIAMFSSSSNDRFTFNDDGTTRFHVYGTPATTAATLGKTESGYIASFADDGTVTSYKLARDTFIEDVTLFSVGTMMYDCQELTVVSSMTVLAPSNQEIRFPDASDLLRGKKIIVYSKKKDSGAFIPQIKVVGGVSRLYFTTNPAVGGTDPSDQSTLSIDDSTWSDHGTTFEFTCLKIDNTPSYRWVLKQR